ncbi:MAG: hypothetical protein JWQ40_4247 [Segetibacter sp.]|nr:hypothetical protein [Segetibacter sp.]
MTFRAIPLLLFFLPGFISGKVRAQKTASSIERPKESFYSITRNKAWTVNQYLITSKKADKKSSFNNSTFRFNQDDTSTFLIEATGSNSMVGHWHEQDNDKFIFSLPLITKDSSSIVATGADHSNPSTPQYRAVSVKNSPSDSSYNEIAQLLSGGPMQVVQLKPAKITLRLVDAMRGEVFIELTRKD